MFSFLKKNKSNLKTEESIVIDSPISSAWKKLFQTRVETEIDYHLSNLSSFDDKFVNDEIKFTTRPHSSLAFWFDESSRLKFAGAESKFYEAYADIALKIANAILQSPQERIDEWNKGDLYVDLFEPQIQVYKSFLIAYLENQSIDNATLVSSSQHFMDYQLKTHRGSSWDDLAQSYYLSAVWNFMIAGDLKLAEEKLNLKRKMQWVQRVFDWTVELNNLCKLQKEGEDVQNDLQDMFDNVFDVIRHPDWKITPEFEERSIANLQDKIYLFGNADYIRFQLAVLRWLYVERKPLEGNWSDVLAQVSK